MDRQPRLPRMLSVDQLDEEFREAFVEPINLGEQRTGASIHTLNLQTLLYKPVEPGLLFQCRLSRIDDQFQPNFELFLEDSLGGERYVMSAVKKTGTDPKYEIYHKDPISESITVLGHVSSNLIGTTFSVYEGSKEIAYISYESNLTGPKQPRKIRLVIPSIINGERFQGEKKLHDAVKQGNEKRCYVELFNKQPEWSQASHAFVLNFGGRVLVSSVKNFQIIHQDDLDYITLQFGKVRDNLFNLDCKYPFSLLQAFGIVLTSFDTKITSE